MSLSSSSTLEDALAQYNDNLNYDGDVSKATLALEAVRWLLVNRPQSGSDSGVRLDFEDLAEEKKRLEKIVRLEGNRANRSCFTRGRPRQP